MADEKSTSEVRMTCTDVVHQQALVCEQRMANIEGKIDDLAGDVKELKDSVKEDVKDIRADLKRVEQQSIRLDSRWKLFTIAVAVLSVIGMILSILDALRTMYGG